MASPTQTPEARAYTEWCCSCQGKPNHAETDARWLQFLVTSFKARRDPRVFLPLLKPVREAGLVVAHQYVVHKLDPPTFIMRTKAEFGDPYVDSLVMHGIVASVPQPAYAELEAELHLEALKAYEPIRELNLTEADDCSPVGVPAATMFYRYIDKTHELLALPRVVELVRHLPSFSEMSEEIMRSGQFAVYSIKGPRERAKYQKLLEPEAVDGESGLLPRE